MESIAEIKKVFADADISEYSGLIEKYGDDERDGVKKIIASAQKTIDVVHKSNDHPLSANTRPPCFPMAGPPYRILYSPEPGSPIPDPINVPVSPYIPLQNRGKQEKYRIFFPSSHEKNPQKPMAVSRYFDRHLFLPSNNRLPGIANTTYILFSYSIINFVKIRYFLIIRQPAFSLFPPSLPYNSVPLPKSSPSLPFPSPILEKERIPFFPIEPSTLSRKQTE